MADDKKAVGIEIVADVKKTVSGINLMTSQAAELEKQLEAVQKILTKIEKINISNPKSSRQFDAYNKYSSQGLAQATNPGGRSNIDNRVIDDIVRSQQRNMKNNVDNIQAAMKLFTDRLTEMLKNSASEVRKANSVLADVRRQDNASRVGGRSASEVIYDRERAAAEKENARLDRELAAQKKKNAAEALAEARAQNRIFNIRDRQEAANAPLSTEAINRGVSRRFAFAQGARTFEGGTPLLQDRLGTFSDYAMIGGTIALAGKMASAVVDLDKEMRQFQAITATSNSEMKGFEQSLLNMAAASKFSAVELAQTATILGQAGLSAKQVGPALDAVARLALASGSTLKETVDVVTSVVGVFNLQGTETKDVANTLTSALNLTKLTMEKLALGFQYSANVAKDLGLSYTELAASLGTLANSGIRSGSTLGTGLRQLMVDLQTPTAKAQEIFSRLGITFDDIDVKTRGLTGVLERLREKGFTTADAFLAFEVRSVQAFSALTAGTAATRRNEQAMILSSAATEAAAVQMLSFSNQAARAGNATNVTVYRAFKPLLDALTAITSKLADAIGWVSQFDVALGILGTGAGVIGLSLVVTKLALFANSLMGIAAGFRLVSAAMLSIPGLGLATGIGVGVTAAVVAGASMMPSTESRVDAARGRVSETTGRYDEAAGSINRINEAVATLIRRQSELDQSESARQTMLFELQRAFGTLGFTLNDTSLKAMDMVRALQALQPALLRTAQVENTQRIMDQQRLIRERETQFGETVRRNRGTGDWIGNYLYPNSNISRIAETSYNKNGELNGTPQERMLVVLQAIADLQKIIADNEAKARQSGRESTDNKNLADLLANLERLKAQSGQLAGDNINLTNFQREGVRRQVDGLINQNNGTGSLQSDVQNVESRARAQLTEIEKLLNPLERDERGKAFDEEVKKLFETLIERRRQMIENLRVQFAGNKEALDELDDLLKNDSIKLARDRILGDRSAFGQRDKPVTQDIRNSRYERQTGALRAELSEIQTRAGISVDPAAIARMRERAKVIAEEILKSEIERFNSNEQTLARIGPAEFKDQRESLRRQLAEEAKRAEEQLAEKQREAQQYQYRKLAENLNSQLDVLNRQSGLISQRMRDPNLSEARARELTEEFERIRNQRLEILKKINDASMLANPPRGGLQLGPNANASDRQFLSNGDLRALILRGESSGNIDAVNRDRGLSGRGTPSHAYGLYQFLPSTLFSLLSDNRWTDEFGNNPLVSRGIRNHSQLRTEIGSGNFTLSREQQERLFDQNIERIDKSLESNGLSLTATNRAMSWFLGPTGAGRLLKAQQTNPNADALQAGAISAEGLDLNRLPPGSTVQQVYDFYIQRVLRMSGNGLTTERQNREAAGQQTIQAQQLQDVQTDLQNSADRIRAATRDSREQVAIAQAKVDGLRYNETQGRAAPYEVTDAERELRLARINDLNRQSALIGTEVLRMETQVTELGKDREKNLDRIRAYEAAIEGFKKQQLDLSRQMNGLDSNRTPPAFDYTKMTDSFLVGRGFLNQNGQVNTLGMMSRDYNQFLGSVTDGFSNLFTTVALGSKGAGEAFKAFGLSVISSAMNIISRRLAEQLLYSIFGSGASGGGASSGGFFGVIAGLLGLGGGASAFGGTAGGAFSAGAGGYMGMGPFMSLGGTVRAALGYSVPTRDSVNILAQPGEVVLRKSAVEMVGRDNLMEINNLGNRKISESLNVPANDNSPAKNSGNVVNFWVVSPDQVPPPSEKDIVVMVAKDIQNRGTIKQLIQQVNMGQI